MPCLKVILVSLMWVSQSVKQRRREILLPFLALLSSGLFLQSFDCEAKTKKSVSKKLSLHSGDAQSVDLLWKARGLQASERLDVLKKKKASGGAGALSLQERCDWILEHSFFAHGLPELSETNKRVVGTVVEYFLLVAPDFENPNNTYQVAFLYPKAGGTVQAAITYELAKNWKSVTIPPNLVVLKGDGCAFKFDIDSPFSGKAIPD